MLLQPVHIHITAPCGTWGFPLLWDQRTYNAEEFWSKIQTKIIAKLSQKGWQFDQIVLSSPNGFYRVEDEDDFEDFVNIARDDGITKIHLRVGPPPSSATDLQVRYHPTTEVQFALHT